MRFGRRVVPGWERVGIAAVRRWHPVAGRLEVLRGLAAAGKLVVLRTLAAAGKLVVLRVLAAAGTCRVRLLVVLALAGCRQLPTVAVARSMRSQLLVQTFVTDLARDWHLCTLGIG